jgi:hypothetical protein
MIGFICYISNATVRLLTLPHKAITLSLTVSPIGPLISLAFYHW